jgi:hypothetical protein
VKRNRRFGRGCREGNWKLDIPYIQQECAYATLVCLGRTIAQAVSLVAGSPPQRPGFEPRLGHVGFVVNKVTLEQVPLPILIPLTAAH